MQQAIMLTDATAPTGQKISYTSKLGQGGSLPLSDIMSLISKTAKLQVEVNKALAEAKKKPTTLCVRECVSLTSRW